MTIALICTGFYHNATSLAAQTLDSAGLPVALETQAKDYANPDSHYDDAVMVQLHDQLLQYVGSDWTYHGQSPLPIYADCVQGMRNYIRQREQTKPTIWAAKDSRASLFLTHWQKALGNRGRFIILYRHWSLSIQSLLLHHSRSIAHRLPTGRPLTQELRFWQAPKLAARMWLTYNQSIVDFCGLQPENVMLINQATLNPGSDLLAEINQRFGLDLHPKLGEHFDAEPLTNELDPAITSLLPPGIQERLRRTLDSLDRISGIKTPDPASLKPSTQTWHMFRDPLLEQLRSSAPSQVNDIKPKEAVAELDEIQLTAALNTLLNDGRLADTKSSLPLFQGLQRLAPGSNQVHEWHGRIALAQGRPNDALQHLMKVTENGDLDQLDLRLLMGDAFNAEGNTSKARECYLACIEEHPDHSESYYKLGLLLKNEKSFDKACNRLRRALSLNPGNQSYQIEFLTTTYQMGQRDEAIAKAEKLWQQDHNPEIGHQLANWIMAIDKSAGDQVYREVVRHQLMDQGFKRWLSTLAEQAKPLEALGQLVDMLLLHWANILNQYIDDWLHNIVIDKDIADLPADASTWLQRAERFLEAGQTERAEACLDKALSLNPNLRPAFAHKFELLEQRGDVTGQLTLLTDVEERFPRILQWRVRYALLRRNRGALRFALDRLAHLAEEFPTGLPPRIQAGVTARLLGWRPLALDWFNKALEINHDQQIINQIITELLYLGRIDQAQEIHQQYPLPDDLTSSIALASWLDRQAAGNHLIQRLLKNPVDQQLPLLRQGRELGLLAECEQALQQRSEVLPWEVVCWRIHNLLDLGMRKQARALLAELNTDDLDATGRLELAEMWLRSGFPAPALNLLHRTLEAQGVVATPESALRICHQFGETAGRDNLFAQCREAGLVEYGEIVNQAWRLCSDGHLEKGETLLEEAVAENPDLPGLRWKAKMALHHRKFAKVAEFLPIQIDEAPALDELHIQLESLLGDEKTDQAELLLERFQHNYARQDIALIQSRIMQHNLDFEGAINLLQATVPTCRTDTEMTLELVRLLAEAGDPESAETLLDRLEKIVPLRAGIAITRQKLALERSQDWQAWQRVYQYYDSRLDFDDRHGILMYRLHCLMHMRKYDSAERMLDRFLQWIPLLPIPEARRFTYRLQCAALLTSLNRQHDSEAILKNLLSTPVNHENHYLVAAANESFGLRRIDRFVDMRKRLANPRFHVEPSRSIIPDATPPLRTAVLLHLFYPEFWPEIRQQLQSLQGTDFHLFVSVGIYDLTPEIVEQIKAIDPSAQIVHVENRGFDVGAHWQTLARVDLASFDLVMLLQSKKSTHIKTGYIWRTNLMQALIGSREQWLANLNTFATDKNVGMIGSVYHHSAMDDWQYPAMRELIKMLGLPERFEEVKQLYQYVGGTMFLIRASLLQELFEKTRKRLVFERYEDLSLAKRLDKSLAHAMERIFGIYTCWRGFRIIWRE